MGPVKIWRERLIAARLEAVRLKAARRKAARLKAAKGFPDKRKAVSRGVRKHEHPTDRGARDGCGVLNRYDYEYEFGNVYARMNMNMMGRML